MLFAVSFSLLALHARWRERAVDDRLARQEIVILAAIVDAKVTTVIVRAVSAGCERSLVDNDRRVIVGGGDTGRGRQRRGGGPAARVRERAPSRLARCPNLRSPLAVAMRRVGAR